MILAGLGAEDGFDNANLDLFGEAITDLIMWRDAAKSTLWFGFGSLCFLSSCFAKGINFRWATLLFRFSFSFDFVIVYRWMMPIDFLLGYAFQHFCSSLPAGASIFGLIFFLEFDLSKVFLYYNLMLMRGQPRLCQASNVNLHW